MEFEKIKNDTLTKANIICTKGFFRFVNHVDKIATTGYKFSNTLWTQRNEFVFDRRTLPAMKRTYAEIFGENLLPLFQVVKRDVGTNEIIALVAKPHRSEEIANSIATNCNHWADAGFIYEVLPVTTAEAIELEKKINK